MVASRAPAGVGARDADRAASCGRSTSPLDDWQRQRPMSEPSFEAPIQNLGVFDILGVRHDGGIDAVIVAATPIDGQPETLRALAVIIRNYVEELSSESFLLKHPRVPTGRVRIILKCHSSVDAAAHGLVSSLSKEVEAAGILLEVERVVV